MDMHYKEQSPESTVDFLKRKISNMGLQTEEICLRKSRIGTSSVRVVFKNTNIGTNGKGTDLSYCMASAYAELFERFSNNYINPVPDFRSGRTEPFEYFPDEALMTAEELIREDNDFIRYFFKNRNLENELPAVKTRAFESINVPDHIKNGVNRYISIPFYDLHSRRITHLPYALSIHHYGSNGMAAGNTLAEAVVQGLSEIVERYVQREIIERRLCLPDVPDEEIRKYPYVWEMFSRLHCFDSIYARMKDCSLGGQYPVAGLLLIEKNTGRYGFKLGCHPDFGVAMERTLTEATQGGEIVDYAGRSHVDFSNDSVKTAYNIMNSFATGRAQYPYQVIEDPVDPFTHVKSVSCMTNSMIAESWIADMTERGWRVLIRDNSWLGFPAVHIMIPGISEAYALTDMDIKAGNTCSYLANKLRTPSQITESDIRYLRNYLNYIRGNILLDNASAILPFRRQSIFEKDPTASVRYLSAMCDVASGDFSSALLKISKITEALNKIKLSHEEEQLIRSDYLYLSAFSVLKDHSKVMHIIKNLIDGPLLDGLDTKYSLPKRILTRILPDISREDIDAEIESLADIYRVKDTLLKEMINTKIDQRNIGAAFS